ncbi:NAD(P)-dependent oxidoreductase [Alicyclobacillus dauci]|uniref:NAD(P)-dependent oxidoreductase n=1 Tax=Alicyclobacillus dauci TaxID=1475485 RepID=A0ABY6Z7P1_9BACL|nr:NAD(P)-dependent oxidoreductase [Alicyclobacillus dauci]WAH38907.1 NAD(P)-dependent oxidoreductase [Alicyclobacillus dauci]
MRIGWIGLGNMGVPMVRNIAKSGLLIQAYNRTPKDLDLNGAELATGLSTAVHKKDTVVIMVSDAAAVNDVLYHQGAIDNLTKGTLIVNMSTIGVDETQTLADDLRSRGFRFMDAPVLGSTKPAADATLTVVAGGERADFEEMTALFDAVSKAAFHIGPVGKGAAMKLLVNTFLGLSVQALGECITFGRHSALSPDLVLDVLETSAVWSPMLAGKRQKVISEDYSAQFALRHLTKDLGLAIRQGDLTGAAMPAATRTHETYTAALNAGYGDHDMIAIIQYLQSLSEADR